MIVDKTKYLLVAVLAAALGWCATIAWLTAPIDRTPTTILISAPANVAPIRPVAFDFGFQVPHPTRMAPHTVINAGPGNAESEVPSPEQSAAEDPSPEPPVAKETKLPTQSILAGSSMAVAALGYFLSTGGFAQVTLSGALGYFSLGVWIIAQLPQIIKNQRRKKAEDLSIDFLLLWLIGDVSNLVGCILIEGALTQKLLALYFVASCLVLLWQWWMYGRDSSGEGMSTTSKMFWGLSSLGAIGGLVWIIVQGGTAMAVGDYLGWVSGAVYLLSRVPQIYQNWTSRKVEDLSIFLFVLAVIGNTTYAASLLAISLDPVWIRRQAPFLFGSLGTLVFDAILVFQILTYKPKDPPLLTS